MGVLDGKAAIVTGGSKGIGATIAIGLGEAGASVVVNSASSRDGAERTVEVIRSRGGNAVAVGGDVSKASDVAKLFAEADAAYGTWDILVNNAAVYTFGPLESVTEEEFRRHFDTNVLGIYFHHQGRGQALWSQRRQHYQCRHGGHSVHEAKQRALHLDKGSRGRHHEDAGKGVRVTPNSSELFRPWRYGYRRCKKSGDHGQLSHPRNSCSYTFGAVRRTTRYGPSGGFSGI